MNRENDSFKKYYLIGGENTKIIKITFLLVLIPALIILLFNTNKEKEMKFISNMNIRVKQEKTEEITEVPFEEYIIGVLAGEMPASFQIEALKAQAVAARSYAMKKMSYNKDKDYDVVDTVMNQVYLDDNYLQTVWKDEYQTKIAKIKKAVLETNGEYLEYDGKIVEAFFFSTSVGKTENSEEIFTKKVPYLRSVDSSFEEGVSPVFYDYFTFDKKEFYQKLGLPYNKNLIQKVLKTTSTGRIMEIMLNNKNFSASEVVGKLNLRSAYFMIKQEGEQIKITTKGYGHGVGMSQYGAEALARQGYKYDEILKHYYLGVKIKKLV